MEFKLTEAPAKPPRVRAIEVAEAHIGDKTEAYVAVIFDYYNEATETYTPGEPALISAREARHRAEMISGMPGATDYTEALLKAANLVDRANGVTPEGDKLYDTKMRHFAGEEKYLVG